jgi:uncharacterized Zn-binding protein involved in type VI secretion
MPGAARLLDPTNHPGAITGPGVPTVLINGRPAVCQGDQHASSMPPTAGPHPPNPIAKGSLTVSDRQPAGRTYGRPHRLRRHDRRRFDRRVHWRLNSARP